MIFRQPMIDQILIGEKRVTRRPVKLTVSGKTVPCTYKPGGGPGGTYALQGPPAKGSKARARTIPGYRLRVVGVDEPERAWDISDEEAGLEGFESRTAFRSYWLLLYGREGRNLRVWPIHFELQPRYLLRASAGQTRMWHEHQVPDRAAAEALIASHPRRRYVITDQHAGEQIELEAML